MKPIIAIISVLGLCLLWNPPSVPAQFIEAGVQKLETPIEAPDFNLDVLEGGKISLKELKGKIVLLNFFSPSCSVCQKEASSFDKLNAAMKGKIGKDIVLLQIATGATEEQALEFKRKFKISLTILMDYDREVGKAFRLFGLHETFFINREGRIIGKTFEGGKEWTSPKMLNLIEHLLATGK